MIATPSRAKTVIVRKKPISDSDSTSKNTFKKLISILEIRWFGLQLQFQVIENGLSFNKTRNDLN
jgi:hypothetical protein